MGEVGFTYAALVSWSKVMQAVFEFKTPPGVGLDQERQAPERKEIDNERPKTKIMATRCS
jgi:hypothetical protein